MEMPGHEDCGTLAAFDRGPSMTDIFQSCPRLG